MSQRELHLSFSSYNSTLLYDFLSPGKCELMWNSKKNNGVNVKKLELSS